MSIYSTNRSGNMLLGTVNERYSGIDAGTIMCDTEANTMAIFEAILYSDFHELEGRKNGVLTEAEAKKFNMDSVKGLRDKLLAALKTCKDKILELLRACGEKIFSYTKTDGTKLWNEVEAALKANPNWSGSVKISYYDPSASVFEIPDDIVNDFTVIVRNPHKETPKDIISKYLSLDGEKVSPGNYVKKALAAAKETKTIDRSTIRDYANSIKNAKQHIAKINEEKQKIESSFNAIAKKIRELCNGNIPNIVPLNNMTNAFQTVTTTIARAAVAAAKANIGATRLGLTRALGSINKEAKHLNDAAMLEACTEMNYVFSDAYPITDEAKAYVEAVFGC